MTGSARKALYVFGLSLLCPSPASSQTGTDEIIFMPSAVQGPLKLANVSQYISGNSGEKWGSWTIFVVCNRHWIEQPAAMERLRAQFLSFGKAIGARDLAIWPTDANGNYDGESGRSLCRQLKLTPDESPWLVTTKQWPGLKSAFEQSLKISFGSLSAADTEFAIDKLTNQILLQNFDQSGLNSNIFWQKLYDAAGAFGAWASSTASKIRISLKTPVATVEIGPAH